MTQRSIQTEGTRTVVIRVGGDVQVEGWDEERVIASTESRWGLKVERRSETETARVRAQVGDRVLFDLHVDPLGSLRGNAEKIVEVAITGSGKVSVPRGSLVKVYAGKSIDLRGVRGEVSVYAGGAARVREVKTLVNASAGGAMDLECESLASDNCKLTAGRDLRIYVRDLADTRISVDDLGGYWVGTVGAGTRKLRLTAGGDVTLVTAEKVRGEPPDNVLGHIETPEETARMANGSN